MDNDENWEPMSQQDKSCYQLDLTLFDNKILQRDRMETSHYPDEGNENLLYHFQTEKNVVDDFDYLAVMFQMNPYEPLSQELSTTSLTVKREQSIQPTQRGF